MNHVHGVKLFPRKRFRAISLLITLVLAVLPVTLTFAEEKADDNLARAAVDTVHRTAATLEEVIVSGKLDKLSEVQKAIVVAEDRYWARYNDLNKNYLYDITCYIEAPIGSRLKKRRCEAGYVTEGKRETALSLFRGYHEANLRLDTEASIVNSRLSELRKRMLKYTEEDQQALGALVERFMLQERYEQLRKKKFDGHVVVWD